MSRYDLEKVNADRRKRGRAPLTEREAKQVASRHTDGDDASLFAILAATQTNGGHPQHKNESSFGQHHIGHSSDSGSDGGDGGGGGGGGGGD